MHSTVRSWVKRQAHEHRLAGRPVVEIGALDVNGGVRDLFDSQWWGIDQRAGKGVDFVGDAECLFEPPFRPEVVLCLEVLEHSFHPWRILNNAFHVLAEGGFLLLSCRGYDQRGCWPVHDEPFDTLRYSGGVLMVWLREAGFSVIHIEEDGEGPGWLVTAIKG